MAKFQCLLILLVSKPKGICGFNVIVNIYIGPEGEELVMFESGAILFYLAEKFSVMLPVVNTRLRYETVKWLMWGSTNVSQQFKHFGYYFKYCPHKDVHCINRHLDDCKSLLRVLEQQLRSHGKHYVVGG